MAEPLRILLLEDDEGHRELLRHHLGRTMFSGCELTIAGSMREGLDALGSAGFDLLLLDLSLPDSDVTGTMQHIEELSHACPVVVLTSLDDRDTLMRVIEHGADDCLPKTELNDKLLERTIRYTLDRRYMAQRLRESEERLHIQMEFGADAFFEIDSATGRITDVNRMACNNLGYARSELIGMPLESIEVAYSKKELAGILSTPISEKGKTLEGRHQRKDGSTFPVEVRAVAITRNGRRFELCAVRDITERKQTEEQLRYSEQRFRDVTHAAGEYVWEINADMVYTYISSRALQIKGYGPEQLIGHTPLEFMPEEDIEPVKQIVNRAIDTRSAFTLQHRDITPDGDVLWEEVSGMPMFDAEGKVVGLRGTGLGITARVRSEQALRDFSERLRIQLEYGADAFFEIDANGYVSDANQLACSSLGYTRGELIGMSLSDIEVDLSRDRLEEILASELPNEVRTLTGRHRRKDGSTFPVEVRAVTVIEQGRRVDLCNMRDISERLAAEEKLRESEATFRAMAESLPLAVFVSQGVEQTCEYINPRFTELFGYTKEDVPSVAAWWPLAYPDENYRKQVSDEWQCRVEKAIAEGTEIEPMEVVVTSKDGSRRNISWGFISVGERNYAFGLDLTERMHAEARNQLLSEALEQSSEGLVITDAAGDIVHVNPAFCEMTGYARDEVLGRNPRILKSGNQDDAFYAGMWERVSSGKTWQGKVVNLKKNGEYFPAMLTISPIRNASGEIVNFIGLEQNLERFEALEAQFHQAQKMEAIGTLVGGIAHDFNNTLAAITGNLYLAEKQAQNMPEVVERLKKLEDLSLGAAETIKQLLTFSRKGIVEKQSLTLSSFLKETVKLHAVSLPETIRLEVHIEPDDMLIEGDINQLQQVLLNLINNACDALEGEKQPNISITLSRTSLSADEADRLEGCKPGDYACISVEDNGSGIDTTHLPHIFEPFYTTKEIGKGTGLGLAMVYGSIKSHGGSIDVRSRPGNGTRVQVYLPLIAQAETAHAVETTESKQPGWGETILLADDNEIVLSTGTEVLLGLGYKVIKASNGIEAVTQYRAHAGEIDMLLFDVVMPGMSGPEAFEEIRRIAPDIPVLFATGYAMRDSTDELPGPVIGKPFSISLISRMLREVLEGNRRSPAA